MWSVRVYLRRWHRVFSSFDWPAEPNHSLQRDTLTVMTGGVSVRGQLHGKVVLCNKPLMRVPHYVTLAPPVISALFVTVFSCAPV